MKKTLSLLLLSLMVIPANAAQSSRPAMSNKIMSAPERRTASLNQLNTMGNAAHVTTAGGATAIADTTTTGTSTKEEEEKDMREAERNACINNNIGIGNTFVWASRYSDTSNYATMVEDTENPQNNVCFVRVELKSTNESRVSVSDIPAKYFMWGENIECGSWVDKKDMEKRILDARKGARIGGIVASTVGGAGLGVGAMELFGNKLIGGKVEGQKSLQKQELYKSQLLVLQNKGSAEYNSYVDNLRTIKKAYDSGQMTKEEYADYEELVREFVK